MNSAMDNPMCRTCYKMSRHGSKRYPNCTGSCKALQAFKEAEESSRKKGAK